MSEQKEITGHNFVRERMHRYGMEVIENRALPRIEDGLKPIQRLNIWAISEFKTNHFTVSAQLASNTTGSYSPHGEGAAYDAMVNMVRDRYAAIEGQGNFGGLINPAAAPRYTKARLSDFIREICTDLPDMDIVPYCPNYDETKKQPVYLPMMVPYVLLNGTEGIAVGISTKIPGFNLGEICKAVLSYLKGEAAEDAIKQIKAPDGFDCQLLSTKKEIRNLLQTGEGTLEYQCLYDVEQKGKKHILIVKGFCPEFGPTAFLSRCSKLQEDDIIDAVRNESSKDNGNRLVVEYSNPDVLEKKLLPLLRRKVSYKINILFDRNGLLKPELCGLPKIIQEWTEIRRNQVKLTIEAEVKFINEKIGREQARLKAVVNLKDIFAALESKLDFKQYLMEKLGFTAEHAAMIAEMRVESLKRANQDDIKKRISDLEAELAGAKARLGNIDAVMIEQIEKLLGWAKKNHPDFLNRQIEVVK